MTAPAHLLDHRSPLAVKLGIEIVSAAAGEAHYRLPFTESNTTIADVVHGGAILTLADTAATGAVWSEVEQPERYRGLTTNLSHAFLSAARAVDLHAHARVVRRGRSLVFCQVDVVSATGDAVATAQVTYKLSFIASPAETMAGLFEKRSTEEQMQLLAEFEESGAQLYRSWADQTPDDGRRQQLLAAAEREQVNARTLRQVLESD